MDLSRTDPGIAGSGRQALLARWVVVDSGHVLGPGAGVILAGGQIVECVAGAASLRRRAGALGAPVRDLGRGALTAGLINAHSHLELAALQGQVSPEGGFAAWIGRVLERRGALAPDELKRGAREGAARLARGGTTSIGDIDSLGLAPDVLRGSGLRIVQYRELLDAADPERTRAAVRSLGIPVASGPRFAEGLSPHAPFTVSPDLFKAAGAAADRRRLAVTIHWSETEAEVEWLAGRRSPLEGLLGRGPGETGLDRIEAAGLLGPRTSLVHGNHPQAGEPERIAEAGATLVHCPGSHRFFGRGAFPLEAYRGAGVQVALGTDSAASNAELDMLREARLMHASFPACDPVEIWAMATEIGAKAIGQEGHLGRLLPGYGADLAWFLADASHADDVVPALVGGAPACGEIWVAGGSRAPEGGASRAGAGFDR